MTTSRRRRLLIVSQPLEAGVPRHVFDLVSFLDPTAYEIDVACPRVSELWPSLEPLRHVRLHEMAPHRQPALVDGRTLARLLPLVRRADIIHAHSSKAGFLVRLAAAVQGRAAACVFTPHGWSFWSARGARARVYESLERLAARWCRRILAVSEYERRVGLRCRIGVADQYRVIPNGVDLERFSAPPAPVRGRVLMVGRLAAPKRPDVAVHAVAALCSRFPELELHLVGDGPERPRVEALVAGLGLSRRVRLLGTRHDVPALLAEAECLIVTSDYEACPLSVLEGMAAGIPVIAARVGGVPEIVDDGTTGILVEPGRPDELAAALAHLLSDRERARSIGDAGRCKVQAAFSSEGMSRAIVQVYDEVTLAAQVPQASRATAASR